MIPTSFGHGASLVSPTDLYLALVQYRLRKPLIETDALALKDTPDVEINFPYFAATATCVMTPLSSFIQLTVCAAWHVWRNPPSHNTYHLPSVPHQVQQPTTGDEVRIEPR